MRQRHGVSMHWLKLCCPLFLLHVASSWVCQPCQPSLRGGGFDVAEALDGKQATDLEHLMQYPASTAGPRTVLPHDSEKKTDPEQFFDELRDLKDAALHKESEGSSIFNSSDPALEGFDIRRQFLREDASGDSDEMMPNESDQDNSNRNWQPFSVSGDLSDANHSREEILSKYSQIPDVLASDDESKIMEEIQNKYGVRLDLSKRARKRSSADDEIMASEDHIKQTQKKMRSGGSNPGSLSM